MKGPEDHHRFPEKNEGRKPDDDPDPWWSWPLGIAGATVLILRPQWSVALAMFIGVVWAWREETDLGTDPDTVSWSVLGLAFLYFGLEFLFWLAFASDDHAFTELLFPDQDSPLDFRLSFVGWLLLFRAAAGWLRARLL